MQKSLGLCAILRTNSVPLRRGVLIALARTIDYVLFLKNLCMARALTKNMKTQAFSDTADLMTPDKFPMHPDLKAFVDAGNYSNDAVKDFLANLSSPLSEKGALTFVWCGDALNVQLLRWIHGGVDTVIFTQLPGSCLWHLRVPVTDGGRFEYKLNIIGHQGEHWTLDPLNPNRAADPIWTR